jgi:hypothetical protein
MPQSQAVPPGGPLASVTLDLAVAWRAAQDDETVARELAAFAAAVAQRFGDDGVRAMLGLARSAQRCRPGSPLNRRDESRCHTHSA